MDEQAAYWLKHTTTKYSLKPGILKDDKFVLSFLLTRMQKKKKKKQVERKLTTRIVDA